MFKRFFSLTAAVLASLCAGCDDGPATVPGGWRSPATWSVMVYATSSSPLLLEVYGSPFGEPAAGFRDRLVEIMNNKVMGRPMSFTTHPEQALHPRTRVVLAFNPPPDTNSAALCRKEVATAAEPRDKITVVGVFCEDVNQLSTVKGWVKREENSSGKNFQQMMEQVTRELFGTQP